MSSNSDDTKASDLPRGFGSVYYHKRSGRFRASFSSGGKREILGYYILRKDAEHAVLERAHEAIEESLTLCTQLYLEAVSNMKHADDYLDTEPSYIPYGMGSVTYVDGPRIKHYRARFGSGKDRKNLGYFATREEAEQAVLRIAMEDLRGRLELCEELYLEVSESQIYPPL